MCHCLKLCVFALTALIKVLTAVSTRPPSPRHISNVSLVKGSAASPSFSHFRYQESAPEVHSGKLLHPAAPGARGPCLDTQFNWDQSCRIRVRPIPATQARLSRGGQSRQNIYSIKVTLRAKKYFNLKV